MNPYFPTKVKSPVAGKRIAACSAFKEYPCIPERLLCPIVLFAFSVVTITSHLQVLTLASNERIPLNPTMRLLFEISHLRTATPATVSRAGRRQGAEKGRWHFYSDLIECAKPLLEPKAHDLCDLHVLRS